MLLVRIIEGAAVAAAALAASACGTSSSSAPEPEAPFRGEMLVVANKGEASVSLIVLPSGTLLAKLPTGDGPHEVAVSPDGRTAVVSNYGAQTPGSSLTVLDLERQRVVRTISTQPHLRPHGIAFLPDGQHVVVTSEVSKAVLMVDVAAGTVTRTFPTSGDGSHQLVVAPGGRHVYTANVASGTVSRIDLLGQAQTITAPAGQGPEAIDLAPGGGELWVASQGDNSVAVFDAATLARRATFQGGAFPIRLKFTPAGDRVLMTNVTESTVRVFDAATRAGVGVVPFPVDPARRKKNVPPNHPWANSAVPLGILMAPGGGRAYIASDIMDEVAVLDLQTLSIVGRIAVGSGPDGLGYAVLKD